MVISIGQQNTSTFQTGAKDNVFKVRFRANGDLTGDIFYWAVDNIHIYVGYEFNPPLNLVATSEGTPKNDIKLTWSAPAGGGTSNDLHP